MQAVEWMLKGKPTLFGAVSGAISGLVVITPGAGYVDQTGAFVMGMLLSLSAFECAFELRTVRLRVVTVCVCVCVCVYCFYWYSVLIQDPVRKAPTCDQHSH